MNSWIMRFAGFDHSQVGLHEALCTLGNGYFATRGALEEAQADGCHYPGTYLAGCYNKLATTIIGRTLTSEDLVNLPNWLMLYFYPTDSDITWLHTNTLQNHYLKLNLQQGVLQRLTQFVDPKGRETLVVSRRLVHMAQPHIAAIEYTITPLNWSGEITVISGLDGSITNAGVARYRQLSNKHLEIVKMEQTAGDSISLCVETNQSHVRVALAARTQFLVNDKRLPVYAETLYSLETITQLTKLTVTANTPVKIEKITALYSSRDFAITECQTEAETTVQKASRFKSLLKTHKLGWKNLWRHCDISIATKTREQKLLHLHIFHLLQTLSPHTVELDVGTPARGLHGEAYRGHVFWDELFILPFYNWHLPEITRSLLLYRYRRLNAARQLAKEKGYRGAMFPWQSASHGDETNQQWHLNPRSNTWGPDYSSLQHHVNTAIAYNVWQYYQHAQDTVFFNHYGAEILLEIARFWASMTTFNSHTQRYEINGVVGPDEYHECYPGATQPGINNNAYTNIMAVWVIERALALLNLLPNSRVIELREQLNLLDEEIARWQQIIRQMFIPLHTDGIISQFEGYEQLAEFPWQAYQVKYGNIERLDRILKSEGDSPDNYKVSKQADAVMLFYLLPFTELQRLFAQLGYSITPAIVDKTINYYLQRTSHGSTLSKIVFASVLNSLNPSLAREFYWQALVSDYNDTQAGTTSEGIHLGVMAGTVNHVFKHYAGISLENGRLTIRPQLPTEISHFEGSFQLQGNDYSLQIERNSCEIKLESMSLPQTVKVFDQTITLCHGETKHLHLK